MAACRGLFVMSVALGSIATAAAIAQSPQPLGGELQVNAYTADTQEFAAVAVDADGDFVVVWTSDAQDGDSLGVFGRTATSAELSLVVSTPRVRRRAASSSSMRSPWGTRTALRSA